MNVLYKKDSLGAKMSPFINFFCLARVYLRKKDYLCTDKNYRNYEYQRFYNISE